jgi:hypothetical protein
VHYRPVRPRGERELAAAHDLAAPGGEGGEQAVLRRRQGHCLALDAHRVRRWIHGEPLADRLGVVLPAPDQRVEPHHELLERERLDQVVVAARVEAREPVRQRVAGREEEHGRAHPPRAQRLAHVAPVGVRQPDVDHHHLRVEVLDAAEQLGAVGGGLDLEALLAQAAHEHAPKVGVVFCQCHVSVHALRMPQRASARCPHVQEPDEFFASLQGTCKG